MKSLFTTAAALALFAAAPVLAVTKAEVLDNYANIAQAKFWRCPDFGAGA